MKLSKRMWWAVASAPLLFGLSGCSENNEKGVKAEGTSTAPGVATTTEDALKQGAALEKPDAKGAAASGYPGAGKRP